jgi:hypothetical protein
MRAADSWAKPVECLNIAEISAGARALNVEGRPLSESIFLSQAEAVAVLQKSGLPARIKTLQNWEIGRVVPNRYAEAALDEFLQTHPKVSIKRDPTKPGLGLYSSSL